MSLTVRQALSSTLLTSLRPAAGNFLQKRSRYYWRKRPQNPKRALLMQITVPKLPRQDVNRGMIQPKPVEDHDQLFGQDIILKEEVDEILKNNSIILCCLYTQPAYDDQYFYTRFDLQQNNMNMTRMPHHVMRSSLEGTKYHNLQTLCQTQTALVFGEPNLKKMFDIMKQNKYLVILGGLYFEQFLTLDQLKKISQLPEIDQLRGELVGNISSVISSTSHLLQRPLNNILYSTQQREKMLQ